MNLALIPLCLAVATPTFPPLPPAPTNAPAPKAVTKAAAGANDNSVAVAAMVLTTNAQQVIRSLAVIFNASTNPPPPGTNGFLVPTNPPANATVSWTASTTPGVTNYNIYYGVSQNQYTNEIFVTNALSGVVSNLVRGVTYYAAVTAVLTLPGGLLESAFSQEANYTPALPPNPPGGIPSILTAQASRTLFGPWYDIGSLPMLALGTNDTEFYRLSIR
jgi:hypothetical protein